MGHHALLGERWSDQMGVGGKGMGGLGIPCPLNFASQEKGCPVKRERLSETSPAFRILSVEPR